MQTVHVRVNDAATGKPTPCRVRFVDATGKYYAPLGRCSQFPDNVSAFAEGNIYDDGQPWAYIDGACEIALPPGAISVAIRKGIEYAPLDTSLNLVPGKLAMRFTLERWADWQHQGWYAGDGRVHFGTPHEALLQAAGEDLAVVNLLAEEGPAGFAPHLVAFSGQEPCLERAGHMVVVNTHNRHHDGSSLGLLNAHRVVYPLQIEHSEQSDWTVVPWCDQCHRKQGLVVWTSDNDQQGSLPCEALAALILGKVDALEWTAAHLNTAAQSDWFTLLDAGLKIPLIGSSTARSNSHILGRPRTYAALQPGEALTYRNWIEAVRSGRTLVTAGPLLNLKVNGQGLGSVIQLTGGQHKVSVQAEVHSPLPFATVEVCYGPLGRVSSLSQGSSPWRAQLQQELDIPFGGWIAASCWGTKGELLTQTSPIYVIAPGKFPPERIEARQRLAKMLAGLIAQSQQEQPVHARRLQLFQEAYGKLEIR